MRIEIPIPLPTWNRIIRMHPMQRYKMDNIIKQFVSMSIQYEKGLLTQTAYQQRLQLMESSKQEFYKTIRPGSSKKSGSARKRAATRKPSLR